MQICSDEMKGNIASFEKWMASLFMSFLICMMFSGIVQGASTNNSAENDVTSKIENFSEPVDSSLSYIPVDSTKSRLSYGELLAKNAYQLPFCFKSFNQFQNCDDSLKLQKINSATNAHTDTSIQALFIKTGTCTFFNSDAVLAHSNSIILSIQTDRKTPLNFQWFQNWTLTNPHEDTTFIYHINGDFQSTDTVSVVISDSRTDSVLIQSWLFNKPFFIDSTGVYIYRLNQDSSSFTLDTLQYSGLLSMYRDSSFVEYVNNEDSLTTFFQSVHIDSNVSDSILIHTVFQNYNNFLDQDSTMQTSMYDVPFNGTDSIDIGADSLELSDQLNDTLISATPDSLFLFSLPDSGEVVDSLVISFQDSSLDSTAQINEEHLPEDIENNTIEVNSYTPTADTVCTFNDTLLFSVHITSSIQNLPIFRWFVNDSIVAGVDDSVFYFIPIPNEDRIDSIRVEVSDTTTTFASEIIWAVEKREPKNNRPEIISYLPQDTILTFLGDTLYFSVNAKDQEQDSIIYHWFLNDSLIENDGDSGYSLFRYDSLSTIDTIHVSIQDVKHDSMIVISWFVFPFIPENILPEFTIYPRSDTSMAIRDSLLFKCIVRNADVDTIHYAWSLNHQLVENEGDSAFLYLCEYKFHETDTLTVAVYGTDQDTITDYRWIIRKYSSNDVIDELLFSPEVDTFVTKGDSLHLSVTSDLYSDSLKYVWFFNNELIFDHSDSVYTYKSDTIGLKLDTIQVFVIDIINDTSRSYEWRLWNDRPQIPIKLISYFPANDTTIFYGDSLQFRTEIENPLDDSLSFRWFINSDELFVMNDSSIYYVAGDSTRMSDSVQVFISDGDTVINVKWCVNLLNRPTYAELPAPELIFPIDHEEMCEEDKFIWSIDSLDASARSAYRYVFQISTDTLFDKIVVSDTVNVDTCIRCDQLKNYNTLEKERSYYWRLQAIGPAGEVSEYILCKNEFVYLPLFIELTNFYAERNTKGSVVLYWETGYDRQNFGYNIYRSGQTSDNFQKINDRAIVGKRSYSFIDESATGGETFYYKIEEICKNGKTKMHHPISVEASLPENFNLFPNYPNPFNTITLLRYQLPLQSHVTIDIYNVLGRRIRTLIDDTKEAGFYTITWDGLDSDGVPVVSGLYFYRMHAGSFKTTRKMTVVR